MSSSRRCALSSSVPRTPRRRWSRRRWRKRARACSFAATTGAPRSVLSSAPATGVERCSLEAPLYAEAEERRREVDAARGDAAASAGVAVREQRDVQRLTARAEAELKERRWAPARDLLHAGPRRLGGARGRGEAARRRGASRRAPRARPGSAPLARGSREGGSRRSVSPRASTRASTSNCASSAKFPASRPKGALARLAALEERIADTQVDAEKAFRQGLQGRRGARGALAGDASERAGRFAADTVRKDVSQRVAALVDIAAKGDVQAIIGIHGSLSDCRRRIDEVQAFADAEARTAIAGVQKEIEAAHRALAGRVELAAGLDPDGGREECAAALLGQGRLTDAFGAVEEALRQMREAAGQVERADAERLAEARIGSSMPRSPASMPPRSAKRRRRKSGAPSARATARQAEKGGDAGCRRRLRGSACRPCGRAASGTSARRSTRSASPSRSAGRSPTPRPRRKWWSARRSEPRAHRSRHRRRPSRRRRSPSSTRAGEVLEAALADVAVYRAAEQARVEAEQAAELSRRAASAGSREEGRAEGDGERR